jgi:hypothetical protein
MSGKTGSGKGPVTGIVTTVIGFVVLGSIRPKLVVVFAFTYLCRVVPV